MPELRKDAITGRWVIIAAERASRPQLYGKKGSENASAAAAAEPCPFCSGQESMTPPEILAYRAAAGQPNEPGWSVRVVPNKYPALVQQPAQEPGVHPLHESMNALGSHEVIIESSEHVTRMAELSEHQFAEVIRVYQDRITALRASAKWHRVLIYKNEGAAAGASLDHVHTQLVAFPAFPQTASEELGAARQFYDEKRGCIYCALVKSELEAGYRAVRDSGDFVVFCPFAARFPFETWILPKRHTPDFDALSAAERAEFACTLREVLVRIDRCLNRPALNFVLRSGPLASRAPYYHWRIEVMPRITGVAGFEWGTGMFINIAAPEDAARELRNALG